MKPRIVMTTATILTTLLVATVTYSEIYQTDSTSQTTATYTRKFRRTPPIPQAASPWTQSSTPPGYAYPYPQGMGQTDINNSDSPPIGYTNVIDAPHSTINGGRSNNVTKEAVWGYGEVPQTDRGFSTIGGGFENNASGYAASIGGGQANYASGHYPTVAGGSSNVTRSSVGFIGGGFYNRVGGHAASIVGGRENRNDQNGSFIGGGHQNTIEPVPGLERGDKRGDFYGRNAIMAGLRNAISGFTTGSVILAGAHNSLSGSWSGIGHGTHNSVTGEYAWAAGRRASAIKGSVTLTDSQDAPLASTQPDQYSTRFAGGYNLAGGDVATSGSIHAGGNVTVAGTLQADAIAISGQPGLSTTVELAAPGNKIVQLIFVNGLLVEQRQKAQPSN